jgi:hypothetical protein
MQHFYFQDLQELNLIPVLIGLLALDLCFTIFYNITQIRGLFLINEEDIAHILSPNQRKSFLKDQSIQFPFLLNLFILSFLFYSSLLLKLLPYTNRNIFFMY